MSVVLLPTLQPSSKLRELFTCRRPYKQDLASSLTSKQRPTSANLVVDATNRKHRLRQEMQCACWPMSHPSLFPGDPWDKKLRFVFVLAVGTSSTDLSTAVLDSPLQDLIRLNIAQT